MKRRGDVIDGTRGPDELRGTRHPDRLAGYQGDDTVLGFDGNDRLSGGWNDDVVKGGAGDDTVSGGHGINLLWGGTGADGFATHDKGTQIIRDFDAGEGDFVFVQQAQYLNEDGTVRRDRLSVLDDGDDLVLVGLASGQSRDLVRIIDGAGLGLDDILRPEAPADIPADASTTATIAPGETFTGVFEGAGDVDWIRFEAEAQTRYVFTTSGTSPFFRDTAGTIIRYGGEEFQEQLAYFTAPQDGVFFVAPGEYPGYAGEGPGDYSVTFEAIEGDAVPGGASTTQVLPPDATIAGTLEFAADSDSYRFEAAAGSIYVFEITGDLSADDPVSSAHLDLPGIPWASTGRDYVWRSADLTLTEVITYHAAEDEELLVTAATRFPNTGSYLLSATTIDPATEIAADPGTTAMLALGDRIAGSLDYHEDNDWYRVDLAAGETYVFDLVRDVRSGRPVDDPLLTLHDSEGRLIAQDDDGGDRENARLTHVAEEDGHVFASAGAYYNGQMPNLLGDYVLGVEIL
jgi:hypothetical protein